MKAVSWKTQGAVFTFFMQTFSVFLKKSKKLLLVLVTYFLNPIQLYTGRVYCTRFTSFTGKKVTL